MSTFRTSKSIHPKVKEVIVQLSYWLKPEELAFYLDIHPRTVKRIRQIYEETGDIIQPSTEVRGRPRLATWTQGMVSQCY
jgi:transposase